MLQRLILLARNLACSDLMPDRYRAGALRRLGVSIGSNTQIYGGARLRSASISFGDDALLTYGAFYDGGASVVVGDRTWIGPRVSLITQMHEIGSADRRCSPDSIVRPIRIASGCWLGANVTVLPGVTIGRGCVIAAGAVVVRDTRPDGLYAGVPARRVRDLEGSELLVGDGRVELAGR